MGIKERREREKEARREEIISAAEKVFLSKGLAEATMDEIAESAELSKGTLYLYYKSKEDLYLAVTLRGMEVLHGFFENVVSNGDDPLKQIAGLGEAYYEFFQKHRDYFRMFYFFETPQFHSQVSPEMLSVCAEQDGMVWDLVLGVIRHAIDEGFLRPDLNPREVALMLWSNSNGIMRLIDRHADYARNIFGVDLPEVMRKSNGFMVQSMLTEKGKQRFAELQNMLPAGTQAPEA
jgi:TetR/AcrR family transcriptional regulator